MSGSIEIVLIIGGGPGGAVAALALHRAGLAATVYEASPHNRRNEGAFLTIGAHGMFALAQVDVNRAVADAGFPIDRLEVNDPDGETRAIRELPGYYHLRRADLMDVLHAELARRGIRMERGKQLGAITTQRDEITAHFGDGHTAVGGLLLGADGLRSVVRHHVDPEASPGYAGEWMIYGRAPGNPTNARASVLHATRGNSISFGYSVSPELPAETFWYARVSAAPLQTEDLDRVTPGPWHQAIVDLLQEQAPSCVPVVAQSTGELFVGNIYHVAAATRWYAGNVALLGDAAHAISPANAQGASLAFEDAIMLGKALRDLPDTASALHAYERLRRQRVGRLAATAGRASDDRRWINDYPVHWENRITEDLIQQIETTQRTD